MSFLYSSLLSSLLRCVEGHRHSCVIAHVSDPFDSEQLPAIHLPHNQEPALILHLWESGSLGLTVLFPLKSQVHSSVLLWKLKLTRQILFHNGPSVEMPWSLENTLLKEIKYSQTLKLNYLVEQELFEWHKYPWILHCKPRFWFDSTRLS